MSNFMKPELIQLDRGLEICHFGNLPGKFPPHFHNYWLIGCLFGGKRQAIFNGREYQLEPLQTVALNPFEPHSCKDEASNDSAWICVHVPESAMRVIAPLKNGGSRIIFKQNIYKDVGYAEDLAQLFSCARDGNDNVWLNLKNLVLKLAQQEPCKKCKSNGIDADELAIINLCAWLEQNSAQNTGLKEMCLKTKLDKFRLLRKFAAYKGITPYRYLESLRLVNASGLLKSGMAICDAALASGFYDQSHFCRRFKLCTGLTPAAVRSENKIRLGSGK